jgi:hypothetical protein
MDILKPYLTKLEQAIERYPSVNSGLTNLEQKANVKKVYIASGKILIFRLFKVKNMANKTIN